MAEMGLREQIWNRILSSGPGQLLIERVRQAVPAKSRPLHDQSVMTKGGHRDLPPVTRQEVLREALAAWRENPLARRYVRLVTEHVIGGGIRIESEDKEANKFLTDWWEHPQNKMDLRVVSMTDELTRAGNLFGLVSTDAKGMSYVRAIPASDGLCYGVAEIETKENDAEQAVKFIGLRPALSSTGDEWQSYNLDEQRKNGGGFDPVMRHYAINRPVGAVWGESDMRSVAKWLKRFSDWLARRVALNNYRTLFAWVLTGKYRNEDERKKREREVNANPPSANSVLVCDESEVWTVLSPKLESADANKDGEAIKKMIAAGWGIPLHFFAEEGNATRTTAEESGGPTYKMLAQRQRVIQYMVMDLARIALRRRALAGGAGFSADVDFTVRMSDITSRDNTAMGLAANRITVALSTLRDRELITDAEFLRVFYRFAGESENVDIEEMLLGGTAAGPPKVYGTNVSGDLIDDPAKDV